MNKTPYEPTVIYLSDLFAFIAKKIVIIAMICVLSALLVVGFHCISASSEKAIEKYNFELSEYSKWN